MAVAGVASAGRSGLVRPLRRRAVGVEEAESFAFAVPAFGRVQGEVAAAVPWRAGQLAKAIHVLQIRDA